MEKAFFNGSENAQEKWEPDKIQNVPLKFKHELSLVGGCPSRSGINALPAGQGSVPGPRAWVKKKPRDNTRGFGN